MFDPRRMGGQRPPWLQQLGQGLAAQQPMPPQGPPQGAPMGGPPQGMPPQGAMGRPMGGPPGAGFLRDQDAVIRAALQRRGQPIPTGAPQGVVGPQGAPQGALEPDADERGGPPDGDPDDMRARMGGGRPGGGGGWR